jgi:hypothetical protein
MNRRIEELGGHPDLAATALMKAEVAALLCDAGHRAGFWVIPEFEIMGRDQVRRRIDVVWAARQIADGKHVWLPMAAFEIEGHDVAPGSVEKNVDSLQAAVDCGAVVSTMVLFQVGPEGKRWGRKLPTSSVSRAERLLAEFKQQRSSNCPIEVVLDEQISGRLSTWVQMFALRQYHASGQPQAPGG